MAHDTSPQPDTGTMPDQDLGLAGRMARSFIHSPLSPLLLAASLAVGILGLLFTPRQEDPQISVPMVDVFFSYPGASSQQVASLATDPLERMMSEIPGVKHVYSASQRGQGMVTVQFEVGEDMERSLVKLYDKLMSNMDKIPPGVSRPLVKPKGVDDVPVVTLTLWSDELDDAVLRQVAFDVLQRLKEVPKTSQSFIVGGRAEEIRVEILPERLAGYGISAGQIAKTVSAANSEREMGYVETGGGAFKLQSGAFLETTDDVKRLMVGTRDGAPVYVSDIADVTFQPAAAGSIVQYYVGPAHPGSQSEGQTESEAINLGAPAVTIAVAKKPSTNGVTVAEGVLQQIERLKGHVIPDNINVAVTRNYGETANDKVNELLIKLFVATAAVTLLIWFFLGYKPALVVLIVIPVVILATVFAAWLLGYTIDRVSLFALIFSIGILVDDAIVVVENIYRRWLIKGEIETETSVEAVREVGNPTILATFTVIAALLPMGFVSGMMGPYMRPIPVLGSVAMLFSLFAAFIFTPWLAMRIRPTLDQLKKAQDKEHDQSQRLESFFRRTLTPLIENKGKNRAFRLTLYAVLFATFGLFYTTWVTVKMLPLDNKPEFNVVINMPDGTALPVTANTAQALTDELLNLKEVTSVQTYVGTASPFNFNGLVRHTYLRQQPWHGDIQVQLLHKNDRERSSHEIADAARIALKPVADKLGARIQVVEMPPGPPVLQTMVAEIYGPDRATRVQVAQDLTKIFEQASGVVDVDNFLQDPYPTWEFAIDREKAVRHGVSADLINKQLEMAMGGYKLGDIKAGHVLEPRYIVLQLPLSVRAQFARVGELPIPSVNGHLIPLAELGRFRRATQDPIIYHKDLRPVEYVTGEVTGRLGAPIYGMFAVEDLLADYTTPDGVSLAGHYLGPPTDSFASAFEWSGEWTVTYETFRDMGLAFGAALILIYMLVVWEFGNFRLPGIIMAPIPLTLIGIIPGHWLFNAPFTATSMIGFIALAGIIVRNSILLVDFTKHAIADGMDVREAVIQSCRTRTRPIIITALALVAGSSVILTDPIFQGMAISLLFGAIISTLLTLVVIPLGCVRAGESFCPTDANGVAIVGTGGGTAPMTSSAQQTTSAPTSDKASKGRLQKALHMAIFMGPAMAVFMWNWVSANVEILVRLATKIAKSRKLAMLLRGPAKRPAKQPETAVEPEPEPETKTQSQPAVKPAAAKKRSTTKPKAASKPKPKTKPTATPKAATKSPQESAAKPAAKAKRKRRGIRLKSQLPGGSE